MIGCFEDFLKTKEFCGEKQGLLLLLCIFFCNTFKLWKLKICIFLIQNRSGKLISVLCLDFEPVSLNGIPTEPGDGCRKQLLFLFELLLNVWLAVKLKLYIASYFCLALHESTMARKHTCSNKVCSPLQFFSDCAMAKLEIRRKHKERARLNTAQYNKSSSSFRDRRDLSIHMLITAIFQGFRLVNNI